MLKYLKKYIKYAIFAPLFMVGEVIMDLLQPSLMKNIVDEGVLGVSNGGVGNINIVIKTGIVMIVLVILGGLCGILSSVFAQLCSQNFSNDLRKDLFKKIMSFSIEQTDKFSTGSLITRVTNDITQIQNLVNMSVRGFIRTSMLFIGGIICMVRLEPSFGVVIGCALPLIFVCVFFFLYKANPEFTKLQKKLDKVNSCLSESINGIRVVKAFVKEEYEDKRFSMANDELINTQLNVLLLFSYMSPILNIILNISIVAIIKIGSVEVADGNITPGVVMAAITYITQILNAVMRMTMIFQTASRGVASSKRVKEILDCEPALKDGVQADSKHSPKEDNAGTIEFKNVSFVYPNGNGKYILKHINFKVNKGEKIAILGCTGSGKSTLVSLIPRFYDATEGDVYVDGINVKDYCLKNLREKVAFTLQNSEIFCCSIADNISWGKSDATAEEIQKAAKIAQASEFIDSLADGADTIVAQGGNSLSGGQKQRIAIGRAVLKDAEILILDDSTSALDLKTEALFYRALSKAKKDITRIIIAQRIASVMDADKIIVLDNGSIAACGTHRELLKTSRIYQDICASQLTDGGDTDEI